MINRSKWFFVFVSYISRIIPDKLHGFNKTNGQMYRQHWVIGKIAILQNMLLARYIYIYIWLGSFNTVSSITGYLLGRMRSMEQYYRFARDYIDQINKNTSSFASLIPFYLSSGIVISSTSLMTQFSKKFEERAREGKLVKFGVSSRCVSSRDRPPSTNVHICSTGISSIAQTNVSKSSSVRNSVRNSPRFIASMSSICKTEHSLHTLYSTDRSLRSSSARNLELKSFEKMGKERRRKKRKSWKRCNISINNYHRSLNKVWKIFFASSSI